MTSRLRPHPPPLASRALGERARELLGRPVALAPEPGGRRSSARSRARPRRSACAPGCGSARRSRAARRWSWWPPDPVRAEAAWERSLRRLEAIGAAVEPSRPGEAFFATEPLRGLYGGPEAVLARARRGARALRPGSAPARTGSAPSPRRADARPAPPARGRLRGAPSGVLPRLPVSALLGRLATRAAPAGRRGRGAGRGDRLRRLARAARGAHARRARGAARRRGRRPLRRSRGCARCGSRAASTRRCAPGARTRSSSAGSACPRRPRASSSSARSTC